MNDEMIDIETLVIEAWNIAESKGFHAPQVYDGVERVRSFAEAIALIHSELSEALEEFRSGRGFWYEVGGKPEGVMIELADAVMRIFDTAETLYRDGARISLANAIIRKMAYNRTRPRMHGKTM